VSLKVAPTLAGYSSKRARKSRNQVTTLIAFEFVSGAVRLTQIRTPAIMGASVAQAMNFGVDKVGNEEVGGGGGPSPAITTSISSRRAIPAMLLSGWRKVRF
jgi:hypothetical protein